MNRGLWLALIVCGVALALRAALLGRPLALGGILLAVALAAVVIVASPLGDLVSQRLDNGNSNNGRLNLAGQTWESTLKGSPIVGFGTTRDPAGNWHSIAAGSTAECPRCTPPPLGTQGHLWFLLFSTGLVGLALYLSFFGLALVRGAFTPSPYSTAAVSAVLMHLVTLPFYNAVDPALFTAMAAVGLLHRDRLARAAAGSARVPRWVFEPISPGAYLTRARRHLVLLGALVGGGRLWVRPCRSRAALHSKPSRRSSSGTTARSRLWDRPTRPRAPSPLDTEAQLIRSDAVADGIRRVDRLTAQ